MSKWVSARESGWESECVRKLEWEKENYHVQWILEVIVERIDFWKQETIEILILLLILFVWGSFI